MFGVMRRKQEGWLAVSMQAGRIDFAHVVRPLGRRPKLMRLESYARSNNPAAALDLLRRQKGFGKYCCTTLLDAGSYQMLQLDAPEVPEEEWREAMRWRLKDMLEYPVEAATVDVLRLTVGQAVGRTPQVIAVAASDAVLAPRIRAFDDAHLDLRAVDIPEMAQRNIAAFFEDENRGLAMLAFDADGGLLTLTYRGELCVSRRIEVSTGQFEMADDTRRAQLIERVGLELQRSLDNFDRMYTMISVSKVVIGPCPVAPGLVEALREYVYVPVESIDLTSVIDCEAVPEIRNAALQAERLTVIGAALRDEGKEGAA